MAKKETGKDKLANKDLVKSSNHFPVVGIGASAGGLDAFKKLIKAIPENSGMAFVLVQHLDPKHESMLPELLQKVTTIPVLEISDDIKVQPNHIYIIPSNKMMIANDGVLLLSPRTANKNERNLPVDLFFTSLAEVHQSHSIGVVLSGTASDGTKGLKAIKDQGGITFAQSEDSAAFDGMPHSAIQAGVVDFVLPPEAMPQKLLEITKIIVSNGVEADNLPMQDAEVFKQILSLLRIRKETDFTYYKQTTIRRRILRRMALNKNEEPSAYLNYLRENKPEQDILYQDLLIPVTSFFRDAKSFDNLCDTVLPQIVKNKKSGDPIRVWVAGCSTGQEVYSIAMCLKEFLSDQIPSDSYRNSNGEGAVQIFATDISEPAIIKARTGIYIKSETEGLSQQRLQDFFSKTNGSYQVNKSIRDMCVFAVHNFLKDPPFGKMDLISCRNVLIYMEPYLQKKALTTFHYALNKKGFLLLGKSETISPVPELFATAAKADKLFSRKDVPGKFMHLASPRSEQSLHDQHPGLPLEKTRPDFQKTADDIMLSKYTPAGVVVNEEMDIVHFRGKTGAYLEQLPGKPSHNLLKMARNGLAFELRNVLHKATKDKATAIKENIPIDINGFLRNITIEAIPLPDTIEPHYLVLFHEEKEARSQESGARSQQPKSKASAKIKSDNNELRIQQLEKELSQLREDMRSITEDQEAANEELQSANEELLSGSEELQSLNEELETGKEELQSTNEELTVVNQEMISLNEQVTSARNYAEAIIATIREPLLVLDKRLRIQRANSAFYKTFQVNEKDTEGKLIFELGDTQWNIPTLRTMLEEILFHRTQFADFEVRHLFPNIGERVMLLNAREISRDNIDEKLILLSIEDITQRAQAEENRSLLSTIVTSSDDAIISTSLDGIIGSWNKGAEQIFGYSPEQAIGKHISVLIPPEFKQEEEMIISKIRKGQPVLHFDTVRLAKTGTRVNVSLTVSPIKDNEEKITGASEIARDITQRVQAAKQIEESEKRYDMMVMQSPFAFAVLKGKDMVITLANDSIKEMWGKGKEIEGKPLIEILPEIKDQGFPELLDEVYTTDIPYTAYEILTRLQRKGKMEDVYFNFVYQPYREADGTTSGVVIIATEVTPQAILNQRLKESEQHFRLMADLMPAKISNANADGTITYFNKHWIDFSGYSFEELRDFGYHKMIHPDELEEFQTRLQKAAASGTVFEMEMRFMNKSGDYKWHLNLAAPVKDEAGNTKMWVGVTTEIQYQKEKREELEKAVKERTIELSEANEELVQKNQEIALSKYNKRFLSEYSEKFSVYKGHNEFFSSLVQFIADTTNMDYVFVGKLEQTNNNELFIQTIALNAFGKPTGNINYVLAEGPGEQVIHGTLYSYPQKCRIIFPNDKTIASFNAEGYIGYPLYDEAGGAVGLIAVMHEKQIEDPETVSSVLKIVAKRAEIELERIKQEELLVQHNQILKEKNAELGKMNKELESFTYISSHDLQEPLRKIQTIASRILEKEQQTLSSTGKDYFNRMQEAASRMRVLIDDLLVYSRTNSTERKFEKMDLTEIVEEVKTEFKEVIQGKKATIEAIEMCEANIIPFQFRQLFSNLISNSLKFSIPGKPAHIIIKSEIGKGDQLKNEMLVQPTGRAGLPVTKGPFGADTLSPEKKYCHISISDNGIGFDPQYRDRIFQVFQRLHTKTEYEGTGIGLAIVKKIVDNHNGIITASSDVNKGARFDIYIPAG